MARTSVIIPARNEKYLVPTIEDVFRNARGEVEIIAVLEGYYPENWKAVTDKYPNLHTIHHSEAQGMRPAINAAAASAISRGTKYLMKLDAHCSVGEGFDEILKADCDKDWVVVPRRKRLDPETWTLKDVGKPDIDYHYLSFPDDPSDFGGPGLNGKVWEQRIRERFGKPEYDIDDEMSSQGSGWFMHASYFQQLELMDAANYGKFWNEAQELFLKCWLSGGRGVINKKTHYAHWHKGKAGRGYKLPESWLKQGATFTKKWLFNEAWPRQTLPFKTLIERFWPVPSWPENWEELVYGQTKLTVADSIPAVDNVVGCPNVAGDAPMSALKIHSARYGIGETEFIDVRDRLQQLVANNALDIIVNNAFLTPDQNPFRGKQKTLSVTYSYDGGEPILIQRKERDWLIIGQSRIGSKETAELVANREMRAMSVPTPVSTPNFDLVRKQAEAEILGKDALTAAALNDLLIRRFQIPDRRLRGPMPIEVPSFHRDDLAKLFAELGFKCGAEIGVAEGDYSEILLKANPECELLLVDPWAAYDGNAQNKTREKHEYAARETERKTSGYMGVKMVAEYSMDAVRNVPDGFLDFVYLDANHSYPFIMEDIINWTRKVRSGGIVALDDIYKLDEARWGAGPMEAIFDYTRAMRINPWWLIAAHKSVDAFFVKP